MDDPLESTREPTEELKVPPSSNECFSVLIRRVLGNLHSDDVSIGYLIIQFRRRSFGGIFLMLSVLGLIPGIATVAGLTMIVPAIQMALGFRAPLLPRFIRRRRVRVEVIRKLSDRFIGWIERVEKFSRPRWFALGHPIAQILVGIMSLGMAVLIILPLPFTNFPPALAFLAISIGMMQRDGLLNFIGMTVSALALVAGGIMAIAAFDGVSLLLKNWGWL